MIQLCKEDCSRLTVLHKKKISDQVSACTEGGRRTEELDEEQQKQANKQKTDGDCLFAFVHWRFLKPPLSELPFG